MKTIAGRTSNRRSERLSALLGISNSLVALSEPPSSGCILLLAAVVLPVSSPTLNMAFVTSATATLRPAVGRTVSAAPSVTVRSSFVAAPVRRAYALEKVRYARTTRASAAGTPTPDDPAKSIVPGGSSAAEPAAGFNNPAPGFNKVKVSIYIALWYAFNIVYNISNKKVLTWFPVPWFVSWFQLLVGVLYVLPLWGVKIRKSPKVTLAALKTLLPISAAHVVGHVSTVVSLGAVAVSFTHVVKSLEPFVNVVGSAVFLSSVFPIPVYLSLLPVIGGVVMASVSELSFTWLGFLSAMTSNFAFTARNIFSKLSMNKPKGYVPRVIRLAAIWGR
jgi:Triose-phosphate Transporter family